MTLLPCPFCGSSNVQIEQIEASSVCGHVRKSAGCMTEGCRGYQSQLTFETQREAAASWNKRPKSKARKTIHTDRRQKIQLALETMTDDWIDDAKYCAQTVMDMRDILRALTAPSPPSPIPKEP